MGKRKSGTGSIRLRKDGRWEGRVVIGYDEDNLPKTKNVLAKTKAECLEKLKKLREGLTDLPDKTPSDDVLFGTWMDEWYQNSVKSRLRVTTQKTYEQRIYKQIIPKLGAIKLRELTQNDIQNFYTELKRSGRLIRTDIYGTGLSDETIRSIHAHIRSALEKARKDGLIRRNPASDCRISPRKDRELRVLSRDEIRRFLIQAKEEGFYEMFLLELATGMRRGELLALRWDDFNTATGELCILRQVNSVGGKLLIHEPKTKGSMRTVVLPQNVINMLTEYHKTVSSEWMFPSPLDPTKTREPTACRKRMSRILEHSTCHHVRFHDLRHTFATMALEHGMDVKTLAAVIGHSSVATTLDIYSHITETMQEEAANKINRHFGGSDAKAAVGTDTRASENKLAVRDFVPYKGKYRQPGTGCISQVSKNSWQGRINSYDENGKRKPINIYAHTREECEKLITETIRKMKTEKAGS